MSSDENQKKNGKEETKTDKTQSEVKPRFEKPAIKIKVIEVLEEVYARDTT